MNKKTSIVLVELIANFREAISDTAKRLIKVGVPVDDYSTGDAWDEITEILHYYLLCDPIKTALDKSEQASFKFPEYEAAYETYSNLSFIEVIPNEGKDQNNEKYALFGFVRRRDINFNRIRCIRLNKQYDVIDNCILPYEAVTFGLDLLKVSGARQSITKLVIES